MKRFDFVYQHYANDIKERPDGDYVLHSDVQSLIAECETNLELYIIPSLRPGTTAENKAISLLRKLQALASLEVKS